MPAVITCVFDPTDVKYAMLQRCLNQTELAARAGVSYGLVNRALNGQRVGIMSARRIAAALRVELDDICLEGSRGMAGYQLSAAAQRLAELPDKALSKLMRRKPK